MPDPNENIFAVINNSYYHLTASEKKVAEYVLGSKTNVQFMSISELAEESGVAEATISRFCRRLNLKGYNAFRLALAKANATEPSAVRAGAEEALDAPAGSMGELGLRILEADTAALRQTLDMIKPEAIEKAVDLLTGAERVLCMGQGGSMILAKEACHLFSTVSPRFTAITDSHLQVSAAAISGPKDVLLIFSYSGSTKDLMDLMNIAGTHGVKTILVTRFSRSPGAGLADVVLQCGSNEGPYQLGSIAAKMAQLYLVDILFHEFVRRDSDAARRNRESIADALADKHL